MKYSGKVCEEKRNWKQIFLVSNDSNRYYLSSYYLKQSDVFTVDMTAVLLILPQLQHRVLIGFHLVKIFYFYLLLLR